MFYNIKLYKLYNDGRGNEIIPISSLPIFPSEMENLPISKDFINYDSYITLAALEYAKTNGFSHFDIIDEPYIENYRNVYFYNDTSNIKVLSFSQLREVVESQPETTNVLTADLRKNSYILPTKKQVIELSNIIQDDFYDTIFDAERINKILNLFELKVSESIKSDYTFMLRITSTKG
jgi:hypothetical protein